MQDYRKLETLRDNQFKWLITGAAGFIGSNITEYLLLNNQIVIGVDNFETGSRDNLNQIQRIVSNKQWSNLKFFERDITNRDELVDIFDDIDFTLHQAALGSVPRSIENPARTNDVNIGGFVNVMDQSIAARVKAFIYASSSSVYGDHPSLPKIEGVIGNQLSPYAVTKYSNELYAGVFSSIHGIKSIGLRYFNVFGKRQNPGGPYAAVVPLWISAILQNNEIFINGDGTTTRDFCYVKNAVQANILAALNHENCKQSDVFNIAFGQENSLNDLFSLIVDALKNQGFKYTRDASYRDFRAGDIKSSLADISRAKKFLGYCPEYDLRSGLAELSKEILEEISNNV